MTILAYLKLVTPTPHLVQSCLNASCHIHQMNISAFNGQMYFFSPKNPRCPLTSSRLLNQGSMLPPKVLCCLLVDFSPGYVNFSGILWPPSPPRTCLGNIFTQTILAWPWVVVDVSGPHCTLFLTEAQHLCSLPSRSCPNALLKHVDGVRPQWCRAPETESPVPPGKGAHRLIHHDWLLKRIPWCPK